MHYNILFDLTYSIEPYIQDLSNTVDLNVRETKTLERIYIIQDDNGKVFKYSCMPVYNLDNNLQVISLNNLSEKENLYNALVSKANFIIGNSEYYLFIPVLDNGIDLNDLTEIICADVPNINYSYKTWEINRINECLESQHLEYDFYI